MVPSSDLVNAHLAAEWLLREYSLGAGVLTSPRLGPILAPCSNDGTVVGRAPRTASGDTLLANATWRDERASASRHELAAAAWLRDAQGECASVPAFLELAAQLGCVGAPSALALRALRAAEQEALHTRLCAALASKYAGRDVSLELPSEAPRAALDGLDGLLRLATESWLDGCLNEGVAAAIAREAANTALDLEAGVVQMRIAMEEAEHAELGWAILRFAFERGGSTVREAVRACANVELSAAEDRSEDEPRAWAALGRVPRLRAQSLAETHTRHARERLERLLRAA